MSKNRSKALVPTLPEAAAGDQPSEHFVKATAPKINQTVVVMPFAD